VAGKVTVGLVSHWPCGTDFSDLSTNGLNGHGKGDNVCTIVVPHVHLENKVR